MNYQAHDCSLTIPSDEWRCTRSDAGRVLYVWMKCPRCRRFTAFRFTIYADGEILEAMACPHCIFWVRGVKLGGWFETIGRRWDYPQPIKRTLLAKLWSAYRTRFARAEGGRS